MRRIDAGADAAIDLAPNPVNAADRWSAVHSFSCSAAINRDARDADYIAASHPHPADVRLISVSLLSLPFRAAYSVGDVAQNTLLGLGHWSWRGTRGVSALRPIGSGLAALLVSAAIGLVLKAARLPPRRLR